MPFIRFSKTLDWYLLNGCVTELCWATFSFSVYFTLDSLVARHPVEDPIGALFDFLGVWQVAEALFVELAPLRGSAELRHFLQQPAGLSPSLSCGLRLFPPVLCPFLSRGLRLFPTGARGLSLALEAALVCRHAAVVMLWSCVWVADGSEEQRSSAVSDG